DLVCRLIGKRNNWTQYDLKQAVGNRIKEHGMLLRLLKEEGRRCWTLQYAEAAHFHLDILAALVGKDYKVLLEKSMSIGNLEEAKGLGIRITDKEHPMYRSATEPAYWLMSNPFGYAIWFEQRASLALVKGRILTESVKPVPSYQPTKLPLQRIVQILKRHRDIMFNGDEDKPISIIITTLAGRAYRKQTNVMEALQAVIDTMHLYVEDRYDNLWGKMVKWISNPVNEEENFADKWPDCPAREQKFFQWLGQVKTDVARLQFQRITEIQESLGHSFGKAAAASAFSIIGERYLQNRQSGGMRMAAGTGMLGSLGRTIVRPHSNFGGNEDDIIV
ncbi:MAG TPA: hypothetical protein VFX43_19190, partial [Chitinophagaceae bacterium]|nr:hypothetical protein [Chitinophagaceae bacterium]